MLNEILVRWTQEKLLSQWDWNQSSLRNGHKYSVMRQDFLVPLRIWEVFLQNTTNIRHPWMDMLKEGSASWNSYTALFVLFIVHCSLGLLAKFSGMKSSSVSSRGVGIWDKPLDGEGWEKGEEAEVLPMLGTPNSLQLSCCCCHHVFYLPVALKTVVAVAAGDCFEVPSMDMLPESGLCGDREQFQHPPNLPEVSTSLLHP